MPSHDSAAELEVWREAEPQIFAAALRRVFSAVVWGNVKPEGVAAIERHGPLRIHGEREIMAQIDAIWPGPGGAAPEAYAW